MVDVPPPPTPPIFIRNAGQFATDALYVAQFPGMLVRVERGAILLQLSDHGNPREGVLMRMEFEGASAAQEVVGENQQNIVFSYFRGNDPTRWQRDVGAFGSVRLHNLYDGIDLVLREEGGMPKYDLCLAAGADLSRVVVNVQGIVGMAITRDGAIEFGSSIGSLRQPEGPSWQVDVSGEKRHSPCKYKLLGESRFGFQVQGFDSTRPFVVDPGLVWSTYLGSSADPGTAGDKGRCVDIAKNGDVVIAGEYSWSDFPTTPGAFHVVGALQDVFVTKLRGLDGSLVYSAVIGGADLGERPTGIKFGRAGRVTVVGATVSADFPTTPGAFDRIVNLGVQGSHDGFVLRLNPNGSVLEYSTYLGGQLEDTPWALALASSGAAIVAGDTTGGPGFPTTPGAFQTSFQGPGQSVVGFITRLDPTGSFVEWSTYLGQQYVSVRGLAIDATEQITLAGNAGTDITFMTTPGALHQYSVPFSDGNVFVARLSADGSSMVWGALFGGGYGMT